MSIIYKNKEVSVKNYLPIDRKYTLIETTIDESLNNLGYCSPLLLDMYFCLNILYLYTDIEFTEAERENASAIYDEFNQSGLFSQIISEIPEEEFISLKSWLEDSIEKREAANQHFAPALHRLLEDLPRYTANLQEQIKNFDKSKFEEIINFVKAANNGEFPNE